MNDVIEKLARELAGRNGWLTGEWERRAAAGDEGVHLFRERARKYARWVAKDIERQIVTAPLVFRKSPVQMDAQQLGRMLAAEVAGKAYR